ncbi:MAG: 2,3-bisphosphoglycerate-independent phosphoglycerate mutase [Christensenellaceae bacterium]|jgi:2,3-bisphosphoglycerate-independent phosphoglycerate mutase|nr:2,3-bisphosphoglycerate-independent phosphoglycerate mutase [Christensenellaceae bacterium]
MQKTVLCILDGLGERAAENGNAVKIAGMPNYFGAISRYPSALINASGTEVGLSSDKDMGNSEVGHNAIGAGRTIEQGLALINNAFADGSIFEGEVWQKLAENAKKTKLNIIMLLSDGKIHSDLNHLFKILGECKKQNVRACIYALADGRDVPPQSIINYIEKTNETIREVGVAAEICVVGGRGKIFMDRYETDISLLKRGFDVCVLGKNCEKTVNFEVAIREQYAAHPNMTDETLEPIKLISSPNIENGDSVLLLNYRGDRAIETCRMFEEGKYISRGDFSRIKDCVFAGVLQYDAETNTPKNFLCSPPVIDGTLTHYLSLNGVRQYSTTETVKFGHLTYFFNGNRTQKIDETLETWNCIETTGVNAKMQSEAIVQSAITAIMSENYDFIKLNLAAPDMVGHTADLNMAIEACKFVDYCLAGLITACEAFGVSLLIVSDHGNIEEMAYENGSPKSSHTTNPVWAVCVSPQPFSLQPKPLGANFGLTNVANTVCAMLGLPQNPKFNPPIFDLKH